MYLSHLIVCLFSADVDEGNTALMQMQKKNKKIERKEKEKTESEAACADKDTLVLYHSSPRASLPSLPYFTTLIQLCF